MPTSTTPATSTMTMTMTRTSAPKLRSRNGCVLCRLRKRKCDEKKPSCDYCQERGADCVTSPRELHQKLERLKSQSKRFDLVLCPAGGPVGGSGSSESGMMIPVSLPSETSNVCVSFLLAKLFTGANTPCSGPGLHPLTVMTELFFANDPNSLTWAVLDAMSTFFWGMTHHDNDVTLRGLQARGTCLTRLGSALSQNSKSFSGDLVAAVALLRSFEQLLPDAARTWLRHAQGMARMFDAMGPEAFQTPAMLRLLENNRWPVIMASSTSRQPSLLNTREWKSVPWQRVGCKDLLQRLLDVYAQVPDIHVLWDNSMGSLVQARSCGNEEEFASRLQEVLLEMQHWRQSARVEIVASVQPWEDTTNTIRCPWQIAVSFAEVHHAYALTLYNMMIVVLVSYLARIGSTKSIMVRRKLDPLHRLLKDSPLPWDDLSKVLASAADEVAMIIPWLMQDGIRGAGSLYLSGPVLICKIFLAPFEPMKSAWFEQMIQEMRFRWRSVIANDGLVFSDD